MVKLTTTRNRPKPFTWSYSRLKNFETCPKRYYNIDVEKKFKEEESEQLAYGDQLHKAMAERLTGAKTPLPEPFKKFEKWAERTLKGPGTILVEQQMAITESLTKASSWFGDDVWFRGVGDVVKINGPVCLAIDWKTGKILEDGVQLALLAQCIFAHHPEVQAIRTEFVWLKEDATTRADFRRGDMAAVWAGLLPRVTTLKNAHEAMDFPPNPSGLCRKYCVVTTCPHHGGD